MNLSHAPEIDCREMSGIHHFVDMSLANQEKGGSLFVEEIETGFASLDRQSLTDLQFNELVSLKYELCHWRILTKNWLVWRLCAGGNVRDRTYRGNKTTCATELAIEP